MSQKDIIMELRNMIENYIKRYDFNQSDFSMLCISHEILYGDDYCMKSDASLNHLLEPSFCLDQKGRLIMK